MRKFEELILKQGNPAEVQENARRQLASILAQSKLHMWRLDDPIPKQGMRLLIGIAVWSVYDMRLLDALDQVLSEMKRPERVDIFNVDDCSTMECLQDYVPRVGKIFHTPVVGIWQNGEQVEQGSGAMAREMVTDHFGIDHRRIVTLPWNEV
jgi:hypothetical protein